MCESSIWKRRADWIPARDSDQKSLAPFDSPRDPPLWPVEAVGICVLIRILQDSLLRGPRCTQSAQKFGNQCCGFAGLGDEKQMAVIDGYQVRVRNKAG